MRNRVPLAAGMLAALVPTLLFAQRRPVPPAAAQPASQAAARPLLAQYAGPHREGSWELTASAGVVVTDKQFGTSQFAPGGTVRVGYNLSPMWNISIGSGFGFPSSPTLTEIQPFAAITWTPDINKATSPFLTVGAGGTYAKFSGFHFTAEYGGHLGAGIRQMIGERVALRVEGREQYEHFKEFPNAVFMGTATLGLSFFVGGGPGRDSDGDGVPDRFDRCPNTPLGAVVDARGCPIDSDHDGVPDGIDKCPNTPPGVRVDAMGCPVDSDNDGVPDQVDRCPNTPAGAHVDANGCPVDSDGDGVPDYLDRCPNTPRGAPVDANGCPKDSDGDGVADYLDHCPNTPSNVRPVDATGCPVDSDHDGVPDYLDRCPNTAANVPVDASGCPLEKDSDGDGVPDSRDKCQNTAHGLRVDADGCPYAELPATNATMVLRSVAFRVNRAVLLRTSMGGLDKIAVAIRATPNARWEIGAYTSSLGAAARNLRLSQQRAEAVKTYLISRGVPSASLTAVGYGAQHPIATNRTARGRRLNMRVEVKRLQ